MESTAKLAEPIPLIPSDYWRVVYLTQQAENRCERMDPSGALQLIREIRAILLAAGGQRG